MLEACESAMEIQRCCPRLEGWTGSHQKVRTEQEQHRKNLAHSQLLPSSSYSFSKQNLRIFQTNGEPSTLQKHGDNKGLEQRRHHYMKGP